MTCHEVMSVKSKIRSTKLRIKWMNTPLLLTQLVTDLTSLGKIKNQNRAKLKFMMEDLYPSSQSVLLCDLVGGPDIKYLNNS